MNADIGGGFYTVKSKIVTTFLDTIMLKKKTNS